MKQRDVVIIGGGPAGLSAAIWCQRLGLDHVLLEGSRELGGQLFSIHNPVIDYPGVQAENGREVQQAFVQHLQDVGCDWQTDVRVTNLDIAGKVLHLERADGGQESLSFHGVIVSTGSSDRRLGVPGEKEMIERGEVYSASRDRDQFAGRTVAVAGGGDRALEGALLLAERGANVVLIHRSDRYRAREEYTTPVFAHPKIKRLTFAQVTAVHGASKVQGITVSFQDGREEQLDVDALFVRIGVEPNSQLLRGQVETDREGYVVVDAVGRTSQEGVLAIGDVCTRPLFTSIASAVGQGMAAAKYLSLHVGQKGVEL